MNEFGNMKWQVRLVSNVFSTSFVIYHDISRRKPFFFSLTVLSTSEVHTFNLFPFHLIFNTFLERKIYQIKSLESQKKFLSNGKY